MSPANPANPPDRIELPVKDERTPRLLVFALLAIAAVCLFVRLRLADAPLERDEGEFGYAAQLVLAGKSPYLAYNYKLPGVAYAYALFFSVFGDTARTIRWALLTANAGACLFLFLLARRMYGGAVAAVAAGSYALASLDVSVLGHAAHATQFANACGLAGLWVWGPAAAPRWRRALLAGLLFGAALLMKQHAAFFLVLGLCRVVFASKAEASWSARARAGALACLGFLLPYLAVCLIAAAQGVWTTFWTWTVIYAASVTSTVGLQNGWAALALHFLGLCEAFGWLWILGWLGLALAFRRGAGVWARLFPLAYAILSLPAVAAGLYFREHYFVLLLPALCLGAGVLWESLRAVLARVGAPRPSCLAGAAFCLCLAFSLYAHRMYFFVLTPERFVKEIYQNNPFAESPLLAAEIQRRVRPGERIAALGSEAQLYFYSRRRSATGFIYMYGLTDKGPRAKEMQERFLQELTESRPRLVVFVGVSSSWGLADRDLEGFFARLDEWLKRNHVLIGRVELDPERSRAVWGPGAMAEAAGVGSVLLVFERRP